MTERERARAKDQREGAKTEIGKPHQSIVGNERRLHHGLAVATHLIQSTDDGDGEAILNPAGVESFCVAVVREGRCNESDEGAVAQVNSFFKEDAIRTNPQKFMDQVLWIGE